MSVHLVAGLGAALVIARYRDGQVLVLVDPATPHQQVMALAQPLLPEAKREKLALALRRR